MERRFILGAALAISNCTSAPDSNVPKRPRPETVAVEYAQQKLGRDFLDPDGKGYNINVIGCGERWCVSLNPGHDPKTGLPPLNIGGGVEIELRKSDLTVLKLSITQ